jgi:hypothetical protein
MIRGPFLADPILGVLAEVVDDLERVRCANDNRLRALTTPTDRPDADGVCRGHGLTLHHPDVARVVAVVGQLRLAEDQAVAGLQKAMRAHPLWAWAKPVHGLGEKQLARLLCAVGDPFWNDLKDEPRTVSQLWAYTGFHVIHPRDSHPADHGARDTHGAGVGGVAPKRQRGQQSNWSEDARKRAWLIAGSMIKEPGRAWPMPDGTAASWRHRRVYEAARDKHAGAVHDQPCSRCGPSGHPAPAGSQLSAGHQKARAVRVVAKTLLKDVWREAARLHGAEIRCAANAAPGRLR